jgi:hypothetical protein
MGDLLRTTWSTGMQKPHRDALESQRGPDGCSAKPLRKLPPRRSNRYGPIATRFQPRVRSASRRSRWFDRGITSPKRRMNQRAARADLSSDRGDFRGLGDQASAAKR